MNAEPQITPELESHAPQIQVLPAPDQPATQVGTPKTLHSPLPTPHSEVRRARNGKVARLPYLQRDLVNRMLRNNIPHAKIVEALRDLGLTVTERNISNWKTRGGYTDWCADEDRAIQTRVLQDNLTEYLRKNDATQLPEVGLQLAATHLSRLLLKSETEQQLADDPDKFNRTVASLCRLAGQLHTLQKYRDESAKSLGSQNHPERLKREAEETVELTRNFFNAPTEPKVAADPIIPHRNYQPRN